MDVCKGLPSQEKIKKFYWARENSKIIELLFGIESSNPIAVRYNWENNPDGNLYNKDGLPACLFRTDNVVNIIYYSHC